METSMQSVQALNSYAATRRYRTVSIEESYRAEQLFSGAGALPEIFAYTSNPNELKLSAPYLLTSET